MSKNLFVSSNNGYFINSGYSIHSGHDHYYNSNNNDNKKLSSIKENLAYVQQEIKYIEDCFGAAMYEFEEETIAELEMLKEMENFYRIQFNNHYYTERGDKNVSTT